MSPRVNEIAKYVLVVAIGAGIGQAIYFSFKYLASDHESQPEFFDRPIVRGVDTTYSGKYKDNPKVMDLLTRAPDLREDALRRVAVRTGLKVEAPDRIVLSFRDTPPDFEHKAVSREVRSPDGLLQLSEIGLEFYVTGTLDIEQTLEHEFTHSVMRQGMGDRYGDMPVWFREGAAVWAANQLDSKVRLLVAYSIYKGKDPLKVLDGLGGKRESGDNYLDEGFVFSLLEKRDGAEGVRQVLGLLFSGMDYDKALESVAGMPAQDFIGLARQYSERVIKDRLEEIGAGELELVVTKNKEKDKADAVVLLREYMKKYPDSFLVPVARFLLARLVFDAYAPEEALTCLDEVIARDADFPWLAAEVTYIRANRLLAAAHYGRAVRAFEEFLRDFSWSEPVRVASAKAYLAEALVGVGSLDRAVELFQSSLQDLEPAQAEYTALFEHTKAMMEDALRMLSVEDAGSGGPPNLENMRASFADGAVYAQMGTCADFERLAKECRVDADCVIVGLPQCLKSCSPGSCGSIGWEKKAAVNKSVRSRYLAMLEDQELAKCKDIACLDCKEPDGPGRIPGTKTDVQPDPSHGAVCESGTCVHREIDK